MKKYLYKSFFTLLLCLGACTSEDVWTDEQPLKNDGEISKIEAVVAAFDWEDLKSRNTISMGSFGEFVQPVWADRDTIGIYPTTGDQLSFPIVDGVGTSTCEFNGGGWALKASSKYTAYYPFNRAYYYKKNNSLPISMLGQFQKSNNSAKHLSNYDIQIAEGKTPEKGKISFNFNHQVCIVRMDLVVPEEDEWTSVKLISDALFTTEATMNFSAETPIITATATSNNVTLELDDIETTEKKKTLTVYMMMLPVDFTGKDLMIVLSSRSKSYIADAVIVNDNRNFQAQKARWITADSFTPLVQADYSWYDSSKDTYYISNESQLNALSKIAGGNAYALSKIGESEAPTFEGKTIYLTNDINLLSLESWTPIEQFSGTFNGNNYTIKNLYCSQSGDLGLFKNISNATIKNLKVIGSITRTFDGTESNPDIGGIACSATNSIFENCVSNVDITTRGDSDTSPISCCIGGICGWGCNSTFIACQSSSEISDNHRPFEWPYYLGGILGYSSSNCKIIACVKTAGDVKEEYTQSYTYVGGIVGFILSGDVYSSIRSCYSSVDVEGRQPGHILGSMGMYAGKPNISASYYAGSGYGMNGVTIYGIGTKYYGGSEKSYDYGTVRSTDLATEIQAMNDAIATWNTENPEMKCNYRYVNGANGLELVAN